MSTRFHKALASVTMSAILGCTAATAAHAITAYPKEGGVWNYGLTGIYASSKYLHDSKSHKSSVKVADRYNSSVCFIAGKESDAALTYLPWDSKSYYYSASC